MMKKIYLIKGVLYCFLMLCDKSHIKSYDESGGWDTVKKKQVRKSKN